MYWALKDNYDWYVNDKATWRREKEHDMTWGAKEHMKKMRKDVWDNTHYERDMSGAGQ